MITFLIVLLMLLSPALGQPASPSPTPPGSLYDAYHGQEGDPPAVEAGGEYYREELNARKTGNPAYFSFMIRETNSEPWRVQGTEMLVWRDTAVLAAVNALLILLLWRRRSKA